MTDRVRTLIVTLDVPTRTDDVARYVDAIRMIRGVAGVDTVVYEGDDQRQAAARKRAAVEDAIQYHQGALAGLIEECYRT